jgi:hypothetical protein
MEHKTGERPLYLFQRVYHFREASSCENCGYRADNHFQLCGDKKCKLLLDRGLTGPDAEVADDMVCDNHKECEE